MYTRGWLCTCLLAALFGGCASYTKLTLKDQEAINASHQQKTYYLRHSFFVGPFFAYNDRLLISERAFDERVLIQSFEGEPILPSEPVGVLPLGTQVRIREIEFPTSAAMASRKYKSPRHFTWVMLDVLAEQQEKPLILVLTQELKSMQDFESALRFYLVSKDPRKKFVASSPKELKAINTKTLIKGMGVDALFRCRGHPDKIIRMFVDGTKVERWQYAPGRVVVLKDDQVDSWEGFPVLELENLENDGLQSSSVTNPIYDGS